MTTKKSDQMICVLRHWFQFKWIFINSLTNEKYQNIKKHSDKNNNIKKDRNKVLIIMKWQTHKRAIQCDYIFLNNELTMNETRSVEDGN